jgi:hypothetical protein
VKIEMRFSEDNAWKNAVVFVLLSQKMKIILSIGKKYTFHYKNH